MSLKPSLDPAYDILRSEEQPLSAIFNPKAVAVIGATDRPGSVGRTVLWNLISSPFGGMVFPINPKRQSVLGIRAYPSICEAPDQVDLAIIATPAASVPGLVQDCVKAGVKGAIVISAGFREIGPAGIELEQQIIEQLRRSPLRLIGPNCLGIMNPLTGLNATFASSLARPGNVGFISQSGALCTAVLDWSFQENVGFSAFVSIGSMLDVDWGDLIYYLGDDPRTKSIVIYMESIGNARSFLSAAREVALTKPIIVIKSGRTAAAAQAAASHTGTLAGQDAVLDAAFRRCGVLRVERVSELFDLAEVLAKQQQRPQGPRLAIITNAGGPGVLATDALINTGGSLAAIADETVAKLSEFLPPHWSQGNPIDILGDADPDRYAKTLEVVAQDPNNDGLLVVLTPQAMTDPTETAEHLKKYAQTSRKPILASWMGGAEVTNGETILNQASVATYRYPDAASRLFNFMWKYSYNLRGIYETPALLPESEFGHTDRSQVDTIIESARAAGRTLLTEVESKQVLSAYGIPTVESCFAATPEAAIAHAKALGYPVVLKLVSHTFVHKTDVGGVKLNLQNATAVKRAFADIQAAITEKAGGEYFQGVTVQPMIDRTQGYEVIIGSSLDAQFGPVILFGTGGQLVEVFKDRAIALPPLNTTLARRLMEQTKIHQALQGVRGRQPANLDELEMLLVRFSQLTLEQPWIKEIDINPLLVAEANHRYPLLALDARIALHPPDTDLATIPKPAIRPYPTQYVSPWQLKDDTAVTVRPIRPEDEPLIVQFHRTLSEESVYFRYFHLMTLNHRIAHERLTRICFVDYDREMALVVDQKDDSGSHQILGVGRLSKSHGANAAEFAMLISDTYQKQGIGTKLLEQLVQVGRDERLDCITAEILHENRAMQRVCEKVGFELRRTPDFMDAKIDLTRDSGQ
ncbi:bifunctional acetate--CoA ligase family protein/GNAT family N-acetyltransferase [Halomicronema sp. CCY15110]|uniref:bifunctional acetate--CoA ligase family protein/GNAT family N-acetyltransferase n=1 Tax=Halomicronema sp. CCY15110 TaxID=2767773 RepID=UPI0019519AE8|nr:bifunctional acetate--CoA ligase family protein/GNAT family N-acetyltransferase [Halomicronema sp. CCY15110]